MTSRTTSYHMPTYPQVFHKDLFVTLLEKGILEYQQSLSKGKATLVKTCMCSAKSKQRGSYYTLYVSSPCTLFVSRYRLHKIRATSNLIFPLQNSFLPSHPTSGNLLSKVYRKHLWSNLAFKIYMFFILYSLPAVLPLWAELQKVGINITFLRTLEQIKT